MPGQLQNVYLTGQGRAPGDLIAIIRRVAQNDVNGGHVETILSPIRQLLLNGYTQQIISLPVPSTVSRLFTTYTLEIQELDLINDDGSRTTYTGDNQPFVLDSFASFFRVMPGRETSISVRLDDSMFVNSGGTYVFDRDQFILTNYSVFATENPQMNGFLSDYVAFDLSGLSPSDQPPFPDASGSATEFFINGDNFAIGTLPDGPPDNATADAKAFYALTPSGYVEGSHVGPRTAYDPSTGRTTLLPGTYSLVQPDPRPPINPASRITALMGSYRTLSHSVTSMGRNPQSFEIIAFPGTRSDDDGLMDIVLFNLSGSTVTKLYFGQIDFGAGTISAFPVAQITNPQDTSNEITGTVSNTVNGSGAATTDFSLIRAGHYTLGPTNLPSSFSTSGRFIVYRR